MYLLSPNGFDGEVSMVLPTAGGLKRRSIQSFALGSPELRSRLDRLKQGTLPVAHKAMLSIPLAEFAFYKPIETAKDLAQQLAAVAKKIEEIIPRVYLRLYSPCSSNKLFKSWRALTTRTISTPSPTKR